MDWSSKHSKGNGGKLKSSSDIFVKAEDVEWEEVAEGIKRKIMGYNDNIMMLSVSFKKGAIGAEHSHYHSQASFVLSGRFEITIGEEVKILGTNDTFIPPSNVPHSSICLEEGVLIDVFSPVRDDFLAGESGYIK